MKTYKTWEMIKELTEHPEKQFNLIENKANMVGFDKETRQLAWEQGSKFEIFNSTLKQDWEEIKKPLTFMEMLEKVEENPYCKVSVEHKEILRKHITGESLKDLLDKLERRFTNAVMAIMLLEGKFYIED